MLLLTGCLRDAPTSDAVPAWDHKPQVPKSIAVCEGKPNRLAISAFTASWYCAEIARTIGLNSHRLRVSISERLSLVTFSHFESRMSEIPKSGTLAFKESNNLVGFYKRSTPDGVGERASPQV